MTQPKWWRESVVPEWDDAKAEIRASWDRVVGMKKIPDPVIADRALETGYQARQAFQHAHSWDDALEDVLREDWALMHLDEHGFASRQDEVAWEQVRDAVQYGWESSPQGGWVLPVMAPTENLSRG